MIFKNLIKCVYNDKLIIKINGTVVSELNFHNIVFFE